MSFQKSSSTLRSRLHLGEIHPALLIGIIAIALVILAIALFALFSLFNSPTFAVSKADEEFSEEQDMGQTDSENGSSASIEETTQPISQICVHVGGCVINPGVYFLDESSRVFDAIQAAGGFAEDAATDSINLARILSDGEQIIVPNYDQVQSDIAVTTAPSQEQTIEEGNSLININTADATLLQTLNGIGEATAAKIIAYREENGAFSTIEDIKNVSGIGDKKFENIKDDICVN